ncbi:hypothetical protein COT30_00515 [Candidatus Micrarchaeota archaeon CG08_land_8_20_14_0_20_49_17]|nr:MAG: hypothetical protein COT30_00515 [Candidatus Micrarchaeota archaeon CG08_land_8_20_14_0_20_49_17]PIU82358.1 MAG: hypothetical protein COS70_01755 [Candidatus Micrarchaeota archaeon CG06_land_8_20_14_3_00_50_6]PIZ96602.1 MAG: hypothetical protein COX84_03755 [Candidatus Micrarchaeota archaeon CG_4_10_14_0_2_um_filter_49_7]
MGIAHELFARWQNPILFWEIVSFAHELCCISSIQEKAQMLAIVANKKLICWQGLNAPAGASDAPLGAYLGDYCRR